MTLRHEPDISHADWFAYSGDSWTQLCCLGPSGFEGYARVFHRLSPGADESDPDELVNLEGDAGPALTALLMSILVRHTRTPDDCFFGLWDGFGEIHGSPSVGIMMSSDEGTPRPEPHIPRAFPRTVIEGRKVEIPHRSYHLFRGRAVEAGEWGAVDLVPGWPREINSPNLSWPADHAWFVATEVDMPWTGIGGTTDLVSELVAHPEIDAAPIEASGSPPYWRT